MRVALIASSYLPHPGALERRVDRLARGLASRGVDVEVLTQGRMRGLPAVSERDGFVVRRFAAPFGRAHAAVAPGLWQYLRRVAGSFDVADAHTTQLSLGLAPVLAGVRRLVLTPHGPVQPLLHWPYVGATSALLGRAVQIVCTSRAQGALLSRASPSATERIAVVPHGVDVGAIRSAEPLPRSRSTVLTVGRLERYQRVDRAIAAMAGLDPGSQLVVVGHGSLRRSLEAHATDLLLSPRVEFAGAVPDVELYRWLRTARVLVTLAQEQTSGVQLLEALAAGVPAVASDIPAHRETAGSSADAANVTFVPPAGSPLEISDAMCEAAGRSAAPPPRTDLLTWNAVVDKTLTVYEAAMLRGARPAGVGRSATTATRLLARAIGGT
jgi:glycosyltransferase involved in cell wall biosynthesis